MNSEFETKIINTLLEEGKISQEDIDEIIPKKQLQEAAGSIDKLYGLIDKAISAVAKAQSAVLDCCDSLDAVLVEATTIGGSLAQTVPSHVKVQISKLTQIADAQLGQIVEGGPSALKSLKDLVENTPYKDIKPEDSKTRIAQIAGQPNLAAGPQSAIAEDLDLSDFYKEYLREQAVNAYSSNVLSFDALRNNQVLGNRLEEDMMEAVNMKQSAPIQVKQVREKMRAAADDIMFEDSEPLQEGKLDFGKIRAFAGQDAMPLRFDSLSDGGHIV